MQIISRRAYQDVRDDGKKHTFVEFTNDGEPDVVHVLHTQESEGFFDPKLMGQEAAAGWITKSCGEGWLVPTDELGDAPTGPTEDPLERADEPAEPAGEEPDITQPVETETITSDDVGDVKTVLEPGEVADPEAYEKAKAEGTIGEHPEPSEEEVDQGHLNTPPDNAPAENLPFDPAQVVPVFTDRGGTDWGYILMDEGGSPMCRRKGGGWEAYAVEGSPSVVLEHMQKAIEAKQGDAS